MKTEFTPDAYGFAPTLAPLTFAMGAIEDGGLLVRSMHGGRLGLSHIDLLRAAPDLLAALQLDMLFHSRPFTRNSLADFKAAGYTGTDDGKEMRAWLESVKNAAIAKATGKASL